MKRLIAVLCLALLANLSAETKILALSGSTREDSINKKLLAEAVEMARQMGANPVVVDLKADQMPLYDGDLEAKTGMPTAAKKLRQLMIESQVILIAAPEYNGSISGVLKNAIDWASRSEEGSGSREAFKGKTFALMSASPGPGGGAKGLTHLKAILEHIGATVLPQQVSVPDAYNAFDAQGKLKDPKIRSALEQEIKAALSSSAL